MGSTVVASLVLTFSVPRSRPEIVSLLTSAVLLQCLESTSMYT